MSTLPSLPDRRHYARAGALLVLSLQAAGCDEKVKLDRQTNENPSVAEPDDLDASTEPMLPSCEGLVDGELCASDRHCIAGKCVFNTCGDGVRAGDEECDDGNESLGDDCNPVCKFTPITCGNAKMELGEECDDGNQNDEDACSKGCTLNVCGNGRRDAKEECDDGNLDNNDYCKNDCKRSLCRNGRLDPGEECDDGNATHTDGCTNDCRAIGCGDGKLYTMAGPLFEECDDGNDVDTDGCSNKCTANRCGNERVDPGELCDGNTSAQGRCNADCKSWGADSCAECMAMKCRDYNGINLYGPCYELATKETLFLGNEPMANFVSYCTELDRCVRKNRCYEQGGARSGTTPCFCGALSVNECQSLGDQLPQGPCVQELLRATKCTDTFPQTYCAFVGIQDLTYASGYAYFLGECRAANCAAECQ